MPTGTARAGFDILEHCHTLGLQQRDPTMIFALEMIARAPLKIPVFTGKYWSTFDDSYSPLPGRDLAAFSRSAPPLRSSSR